MERLRQWPRSSGRRAAWWHGQAGRWPERGHCGCWLCAPLQARPGAPTPPGASRPPRGVAAAAAALGHARAPACVVPTLSPWESCAAAFESGGTKLAVQDMAWQEEKRIESAAFGRARSARGRRGRGKQQWGGAASQLPGEAAAARGAPIAACFGGVQGACAGSTGTGKDWFGRRRRARPPPRSCVGMGPRLRGRERGALARAPARGLKVWGVCLARGRSCGVLLAGMRARDHRQRAASGHPSMVPSPQASPLQQRMHT